MKPSVTQPARAALSTRADPAAPSNPTPDGAALYLVSMTHFVLRDESCVDLRPFLTPSQETARAGFPLSLPATSTAPADNGPRRAGAAACSDEGRIWELHAGEPDLPSVKLSDAAAYVLGLIAAHEGVCAAEAAARAICFYAEHLGIPRPADDSDNLEPRAPP